MAIDEKSFEKLALHSPPASILSLLFQLISHAFVHLDIMHLLGNLTAIGIFSVYERRVGPRRFLAILAVGCILAIPSVFFHAQPYTVCGISGGVYGLAAAYFLDHEDLSLKDWIYSLIALACLMAVFSVINELESKKTLPYNIDYLGHAFGAIGAVAYCYFSPRILK